MEPENRVGNWLLDLFWLFSFFWPKAPRIEKPINGIYLQERVQLWQKNMTKFYDDLLLECRRANLLFLIQKRIGSIYLIQRTSVLQFSLAERKVELRRTGFQNMKFKSQNEIQFSFFSLQMRILEAQIVSMAC